MEGALGTHPATQDHGPCFLASGWDSGTLSYQQNDTQQPQPLTLASESRLAGSAGTAISMVRVSTAMTPTGIPPSLEGEHT